MVILAIAQAIMNKINLHQFDSSISLLPLNGTMNISPLQLFSQKKDKFPWIHLDISTKGSKSFQTFPPKLVFRVKELLL